MSITKPFKRVATTITLTLSVGCASTNTVYSPRDAGDKAEATTNLLGNVACNFLPIDLKRDCNRATRNLADIAEAEARAKAETQGLCKDSERRSTTTTNGKVVTQEKISQHCEGLSPRH